jgi:galactokinase
VLRALHFFDENERAAAQAEALEKGRFESFLRLVVESGRSSWMLLQNCYPGSAVREQGIPLALALSEATLGQRGAWRVHGGGFAGTILAFVPKDLLERYIGEMQAAFGGGSCRSLSIRRQGAGRVELA